MFTSLTWCDTLRLKTWVGGLWSKWPFLRWGPLGIWSMSLGRANNDLLKDARNIFHWMVSKQNPFEHDRFFLSSSDQVEDIFAHQFCNNYHTKRFINPLFLNWREALTKSIFYFNPHSLLLRAKFENIKDNIWLRYRQLAANKGFKVDD